MPDDAGHYWQEAPYIFRRNGYHYLFLNHYTCCSNQSSYEIRVCRSDAGVKGPYFDQNGVNCKKGGGTLVKGRDHGSIGPGHPSIFSYFNAQNEEVLVLNNHYYRDIPSTPDVAFVSFVEHHILR